MFIKEIKITNFKCFSIRNNVLKCNIPNGIDDGSGLNILVGNNNTGKSTVFEAVHFVREGARKDVEDIKNYKALRKSSSDFNVEITLSDNISDVIDKFAQENKKEVIKRLIYKENGKEYLKLSRFFKDKKSAKAISLFNKATAKYVNPSGIDAVVKKLFDMMFIWADTSSADETKFGSTTIFGNLLQDIIEEIEEIEVYEKFKNTFNRTFNSSNSPLRSRIRQIGNKVESKLREQFDNVDLHFEFDPIDLKSIFKNIQIKVNDGVETLLDEKGSGLQRSLVIALLEVYAEEIANRHKSSKKSGNFSKPYFFFIDEPEICLHPLAQLKLLKALITLSKERQIFITTHSPFFFKDTGIKNSAVFIFNKTSGKSNARIKKLTKNLGLFPWSPSWGEINYFAYNNPSVEFHDELYGYLKFRSHNYRESDFENFLSTNGISKSKVWQRDISRNQNPRRVTSQTFIRNKIHHPENRYMRNQNFSIDDLKQSIEEMIRIIKEKGY